MTFNKIKNSFIEKFNKIDIVILTLAALVIFVGLSNQL